MIRGTETIHDRLRSKEAFLYREAQLQSSSLGTSTLAAYGEAQSRRITAFRRAQLQGIEARTGKHISRCSTVQGSTTKIAFVPGSTVLRGAPRAKFSGGDMEECTSSKLSQNPQMAYVLKCFHVHPGTCPCTSLYASTCLPVRSTVLPRTSLYGNKRT